MQTSWQGVDDQKAQNQLVTLNPHWVLKLGGNEDRLLNVKVRPQELDLLFTGSEATVAT